MKYLLTLTLSLFLSLFFLSFSAFSLELTLSQGTVKPTPIAISNLYAADSSLNKLGENISSVISDNLERSGLFISIDKKAFIQTTTTHTQEAKARAMQKTRQAQAETETKARQKRHGQGRSKQGQGRSRGKGKPKQKQKQRPWHDVSDNCCVVDQKGSV